MTRVALNICVLKIMSIWLPEDQFETNNFMTSAPDNDYCNGKSMLMLTRKNMMIITRISITVDELSDAQC